MKIALLTDGIYPYVIGGMQKHSYYLAKYLAAAGHHVDLYHTNQSRYDISKLEFFTEQEKLLIRSFVVKFPQMGRSPGHYIRESYEYSCRVFKLFRENSNGVDFIYAKGFTGWELLNQKMKGFDCPPVGVNLHGFEMFQPPASFIAGLQNRFLLKPTALFQMKNADYLFSYGGKISDVIRSAGMPGEKIIEVPTGIEASWLNDHPESSGPKRKFIFIGRYERRKGIKELQQAIEKISENTGADFEFHFAGPVPANKQVKNKHVTYHGQVDDPAKMKKLLLDSEVLVCPSFSEGMPNVIMEGLASGCAVIATDVGAVNLMVNTGNGWLISPKNQDELVKALEEALRISPAALDEKRTRAVQFVREKFLWDRIAALIVNEILTRLDKRDGTL
ncbi:MAG: hypothetical protein FD123_3596 [Bacteroidetes bacterium]|nr:MAG: hypothetical protein FD123_3596 [Bacteroidota bacterium]